MRLPFGHVGSNPTLSAIRKMTWDHPSLFHLGFKYVRPHFYGRFRGYIEEIMGGCYVPEPFFSRSSLRLSRRCSL